MRTTRKVRLVLAAVATVIYSIWAATDKKINTKALGHQDEQFSSSSSGDFKQNTSIKALIGENVTLPCLPTFKIHDQDDSFEWFKGAEKITLIKEKSINYIHKNYKERINQSALIEELDKGRASLNLYNVNESDGGDYCCCIHHKELKCVGVTLVVMVEDKHGSKNLTSKSNKPATQSASTKLWWLILIALGVLIVR